LANAPPDAPDAPNALRVLEFRPRPAFAATALPLSPLQIVREQSIPRKGDSQPIMIRDYELTFIAKPDLDVTNMTALVERVKGIIAEVSGTIVKLENWGMRHMTYPIRKYRDGQYVHMRVQMDGSAVARVEQRFKLADDVIRHLLVLADEDMPTPAQPVEVQVADDAAAVA
jgi:small subunit ribosomal protein S6